MKRLLLLSFIFFQSAFLNAQVTSCPAETLNASLCETLQIDLQRQMLLQNLVNAAKNNSPDDALLNFSQLHELIETAFQCGLISSCDQLDNILPLTDLGQGWAEEISFDFNDDDSSGSRNCTLFTQINITNGDAIIRGTVSQSTGRLAYQLPSSMCAPFESGIERQTYVNEGGIFLMDQGAQISSPGLWEMFRRNRRTPQVSVLENGMARVLLADDHYFDISPTTGRIAGSDLFDVRAMYDPAVCETTLRTVHRGGESTVRSTPDVSLLRSGRSAIGRHFVDFGSAVNAQQIHNYIDHLSRTPL